jgi:hypothetical protein
LYLSLRCELVHTRKTGLRRITGFRTWRLPHLWQILRDVGRWLAQKSGLGRRGM